MTSHDSGENVVLLTREAKPDNVQAMLELDVYAQSNAGRGTAVREAVETRQCLVAVESDRLIGPFTD